MMNYSFVFQERLGIELLFLEKNWEDYDSRIQFEILEKWEIIRGKIPDRIKEIEQQINQKQQALGEEEDFHRSCQINSQISELASAINDLQIWFRVD